MTDLELIAKRLALVETAVRELRALARLDAIEHDVRERRFVEHTLQIAIQAALDVAAHIVADERLGEPATNRDLFRLLARGDWLPTELTDRLSAMAGFRNVLVHGYADVDLTLLQDAARNRWPDLLAFVEAIRVRLQRGGA